MRSLRPSEQRLVLTLFALLFGVANLLAFSILSDKRRITHRELQQLHLDQMEANAWITDKDLWMKRKAWLDAKQPKTDDFSQEGAHFLQTLQQSARQQNITITQQQLAEPQTTPDYREASVQLEIRGTLQSLVQWLAPLQTPESFQAITSLTLKSDAEPPNVICNLTIARWYAVSP